MSAPCRERILAAIATALAGIAGVGGLVVERDRLADLAETEMPRLVVREGGEEPQADFSGEDAYTMTVEVEGYTAAASQADADAVGRTLRAKVVQALRADVTLGALARDVRQGVEPPPVRLSVVAEVPTYAFALAFAVEYATAEGDPFTFA